MTKEQETIKELFPKTYEAIVNIADNGGQWIDGWPVKEPFNSDLNKDERIQLFCKREYVWQFGEDA